MGLKMSKRDWEQRYVDKETPWDSGQTDTHLLHAIERFELAAGRTLVIGCGTGTNSIALAEAGFEVVGIDLSPTAIATAIGKSEGMRNRPAFQAGDVFEFADRGFDLAYDRGCFHCFEPEKMKDFALLLADILTEGGHWISVIGSTDGPPRETGPPRKSALEIASMIENDFEILLLEATSFDPIFLPQARGWILVARKRTVHSV
jgi:SAM-dependent methyltransferase